MTRGAGTAPVWDVPGAWPGSGVPEAVSSVSQQSRFSDFLGGRDSSGVLRAGGAEKTKAVGVPPDKGTFFSIGGGTGCTGLYPLFFGNYCVCVRRWDENFGDPLPFLPKYACCGLSGRLGSCDPRVRARGWG